MQGHYCLLLHREDIGEQATEETIQRNGENNTKKIRLSYSFDLFMNYFFYLKTRPAAKF